MAAARVPALALPTLFVHGDADEIVPFELGRRLFGLAPEPKDFLRVAGGHHNDTWCVDTGVYLAAIRAFLGRLGMT